MNHQTDDKLITGAFVITASDDDGLIHQPHCQDFIDSAHNKKFFLSGNGKDDRIQSDVTAIALAADGRLIMSKITRFILPKNCKEDEDWLTLSSTTPTAVGVNTIIAIYPILMTLTWVSTMLTVKILTL